MGSTSSLPLLMAMLPMLGSVAVHFVGQKNEKLRDFLVAAISGATFLISIALFLKVRETIVVFELPWFLKFGLRFNVDFISGLFSLIVSLVWFLASLFGFEYMAHEHSRTRFFTYFIFTLGATLGVFLSGDLFSLFMFFELMTFSAYVLVIHEEDNASLHAGDVYLYMSVFGGLCLLAVVFFLEHAAGTTEFIPLLEQIIASGFSPWLLLGFVIFGFGVKAGMIPLHIWLPKAHPVAPSPASALLSALMIKTGAYGFVRFLMTIFTPLSNEALWVYSEHFGYVFLWIGAITMFIGAIMGILNNSLKKILAYSSISQMGYILFSLGAGTFLGTRGAVGFAGAWMHMINHAFFKSFLFLLAGAVYLKTHELDLRKLGGLRNVMPWAFGFFLIAAAGITGVPGFNGYVSKILIHEAILEAYHLVGWESLLWLERIFVVTGGLTAAYITKLWVSIFLGKKGEKSLQVTTDISVAHRAVFGIYSAIILVIGVFAQKMVNSLVIPATKIYRFDVHDLEHLTHVPFWHGAELAGPVLSYVIGISALLIVSKVGSKLKIPEWLSVEYIAYWIWHRLEDLAIFGQKIYVHLMLLIRKIIYWGAKVAIEVPVKFREFGRRVVAFRIQIDFRRFKNLILSLRKFRKRFEVEEIKRKTMVARKYFSKDSLKLKVRLKARSAKDSLKELEQELVEKIEASRMQRIQKRKQQKELLKEKIDDSYWNTINISFDSLIVALVIAIALLVFLSVAL